MGYALVQVSVMHAQMVTFLHDSSTKFVDAPRSRNRGGLRLIVETGDHSLLRIPIEKDAGQWWHVVSKQDDQRRMCRGNPLRKRAAEAHLPISLSGLIEQLKS